MALAQAADEMAHLIAVAAQPRQAVSLAGTPAGPAALSRPTHAS